ncbi:hypothetical protein [Siansivirga zeaxanthinifaciens]|uniref:Uncharacterized protein n=1 Tax=Siansivirga zeaxanthinifaciens CC-SAMT-1 TaxID=1454006 RepID=A0A0C5W960_9FLAO|nr:hypothetical protein [Siansivirga zeaxanthinifaciens]AJR02782.1 hypothetical protein AW14_03150 [Siansivirga zeaxanthinifaciens CC-SAMT-1]
MIIQRPKIAEYLSLFVMTLITVLAIYNKQITVFYILYLFWWDEFLKTVFDRLRYQLKRNQLVNAVVQLSNTKSRLFMLMIYLVFIIVFFGLILDWNHSDLVLSNFEIFFFKNALFNFSLLTFLLREIYKFRSDSHIGLTHHLLSPGVITLHVSLILGILLSFFLKKEFIVFENYVAVLAIIPFLILKLFFEIKEIQYKQADTKKL